MHLPLTTGFQSGTMKFMVLNVLKITNADEAEILQALSVDADFNPGINQDIKELCADMIETLMSKPNGVGLAAPQVGRNLNIFVMRIMEEGQKDEYISLINPHTINETGKKIVAREGCLSIPGVEGDVERFPQVSCTYWDAEGNQHMTVFYDFQARIYQHEFDHLKGILYVMRATQMYKIVKNDGQPTK
jgi:peptide deformylase